jgi:pyruvate/2-oxoglutarate dehydrogenase complex dihydrolipoamide dehydrogenase (E3) component
MMSEILTPDLCVIGAGSGGLSVAAIAASMKVPVVLIEKGEMGGDCLNTGCVPSKALIAAARRAHAMRTAEPFGLTNAYPQVDMQKVHDHIHGVIGAIAPNDSEERFTAMGVQVIGAAAKFTARNTVEAGGKTIRARRFVIATGSSAAIPPIPGLDQVRYLTNETIFNLTERPSRLIIVGGGPIGMELAQAYRRLGAEVTVLEAFKVLGREDSEFSSLVADCLRTEGVDIREGIKIARVEAAGSGARVVLEGDGREEHIDGSHLLIAGGRAPNVNNLGLERAGIAFDRKGISVSKSLRTSNRRVYAIGDVAGGTQFTHAANYHAGLVIRAVLFRMRVKAHDHLIPRVTYTDPEIATAGLTEEQARAKHKKLNIYRWPFSENDRAQAGRETHGHIKVLASAKGHVLGVGIVGPHAGELLGPWQLAITKGLKVADIAGMVMPYPTLQEVSKRAAVLQYQKGLANPWLGRILRFLRKFG